MISRNLSRVHVLCVYQGKPKELRPYRVMFTRGVENSAEVRFSLEPSPDVWVYGSVGLNLRECGSASQGALAEH